VRLVPLDDAVQQAFLADPEYQRAMAREDWPLLARAIQRVLGVVTPAPAADDDTPHWGGYAATDTRTGRLVGSCAFKGPPRDGSVEIAYMTYPEFEGRGYATAMAARLIEVACRCPDVRAVIAHTLPERNASTHVLMKCGMRHAGEVMDPADGRVWRWELPR